MPDITEMFTKLRGDEFIEQLRGVALLASAEGGTLRCGSCPRAAEFIGMQRCGAPGGPICQGCMDEHFDYVRSWVPVEDATPYCRHCDQDVDKHHLYAVNLWDGTECSP